MALQRASNRGGIWKRRWLAPLVIALLATLAANLSTWHVDWLNHLEFGLHQQRLARIPIPPNPDIVLIAITEDTLPLGEGPVPRRYYAQLIRALRQAGAKALVLDLDFDAPTDPRDDEALRQALAKSDPLQIALLAHKEKEKEDPNVPMGFKYWFTPPVVLPRDPPSNVAISQAEAFELDGQYSLVALFLRDENTKKDISHLALSAVLGRHNIAPSEARWNTDREQVTAGALSAWPVGTDGEFHTRWTRSAPRFPWIKYADAVEQLQDGKDAEFFKSKIVIVGKAAGQEDLPNTPLGRMYGMEFVAHMVNTLLDPASQVTRWRIPTNLLWGLLLAMAAAMAIRTLRPLPMMTGLLAALALAWLLPNLTLQVFNLWVDTVGPCLAVLLAVGITALREGARAGAQARRLMPGYLREERPETLTEAATVLFVDLRSSTEMAEQLGPKAAQVVLSDLLRRLSEVIVQHGGEVERMLGDGLMAVFRERGSEHHALRCVAAVRELPQAVASTDARLRQEHGLEVRLTVGMESGLVSGAVVHAADHDEWSSFGPTVNLAARLQAACSEVGKSVLLGPGVWALVRTEVRARLVQTMPLKGIAEPIPIYALEDEQAAAPAGG